MAFYNQKKPTVAEKMDTAPYILHYPHLLSFIHQDDYNYTDQMIEIFSHIKEKKTIIIGSIDPATKNFSLRFEERKIINNELYVTTLHLERKDFSEKIEEILPTKRKNTLENKKTLKDNTKALKDNTKALKENKKVKKNEEYPKIDLLTKIYPNITCYLNENRKFFEQCDIIVMERQLPHNYKAIRISQHVITYLSLLLSDKDKLLIFEIDATLKTRMLKTPKYLSDKQTKQWSVEMATKISEYRKDDYSLKKLKEKKADDMADSIVQIEALFLFFKLPTTYQNIQDEITFNLNPDEKQILAILQK
jgi:hypothetical protein